MKNNIQCCNFKWDRTGLKAGFFLVMENLDSHGMLFHFENL